jgi:hypothetical protein
LLMECASILPTGVPFMHSVQRTHKSTGYWMMQGTVRDNIILATECVQSFSGILCTMYGKLGFLFQSARFCEHTD